ncbi:tyrosine-type recombinase/integrase, partial [Streptomyces sp. NPDC056056]|uniref:tyrosine-type recombinase/integrase n=1 Tax=Streptomyces sp. NPDC056056 TaxID=3345698 RepID=UPI0035DE512D
QQHYGPRTWESKDDCMGWLSGERKLIEFDEWTPPAERLKQQQAEAAKQAEDVLTVAAYCNKWHDETANRHKPRTRTLNKGYLKNVILPELGEIPLADLKLSRVRTWFAKLDPFPTRNANAYSLLRTIMNHAVDEELIAANPCRIKSAGTKKRKVEPIALSPSEIRHIASLMPERWRLLVLVAGFGGLRWGEVTALRRSDFKLTPDDCAVTVARAVVRIKKEVIIDTPKTDAALRTVSLPPELYQQIKDHIGTYAGAGRDGLVFPNDSGEVVHANTVRKWLKKVAEKASVPKLRFHDFRHSAATLFAQQGATLSEHMAFMGHTSVVMSKRYIHANPARNREMAQRMWAA